MQEDKHSKKKKSNSPAAGNGGSSPLSNALLEDEKQTPEPSPSPIASVKNVMPSDSAKTDEDSISTKSDSSTPVKMNSSSKYLESSLKNGISDLPTAFYFNRERYTLNEFTAF